MSNSPNEQQVTTQQANVTQKSSSNSSTHNCDYGIADASPVHNFTHILVDQIDKSRPLLELYKQFTQEQKAEISLGLDTAEKRYLAIRETQLDFICFFDNQAKQPVDIYEKAMESLKMSTTRLANISLARTMLFRWDEDTVYVWSDADNVIARTRFLKPAPKAATRS